MAEIEYVEYLGNELHKYDFKIISSAFHNGKPEVEFYTLVDNTRDSPHVSRPGRDSSSLVAVLVRVKPDRFGLEGASTLKKEYSWTKKDFEKARADILRVALDLYNLPQDIGIVHDHFPVPPLSLDESKKQPGSLNVEELMQSLDYKKIHRMHKANIAFLVYD